MIQSRMTQRDKPSRAGTDSMPTAHPIQDRSHASGPSSRWICTCLLLGVVTLALPQGGCNTISIPNFSGWEVDSSGYEVEALPVLIDASFARGNDVYLLNRRGEVFLADDGDLSQPWASRGRPLAGKGRCLFVSSNDLIFVSGTGQPLYRSVDDGRTYGISLNVPVWRMDEDDEGNLYAGNYTKDAQHVCTLYKSEDSGNTWATVFIDPENHHIHTVRWDNHAKRLYIAYGDGATRGQAYSDDRGETFHILAAGPDQGHTDVAVTSSRIIWASDDQSGRIFDVDKNTGRTQAMTGGSQFMWFAVAGDAQIFVGTMSSKTQGGERAALLASSDEGLTWQKVLESDDLSTHAYSDGMIAESRTLSAGGWLYFTKLGAESMSYRVRREP